MYMFSVVINLFSGQCDVMNVTPQIISEVGGTTLNITVSEPCLLSESDVITCSFDGISVTATYLNPKITQCVVPPVGTVGNVTLTISGVTATNGFFYHQMSISSGIHIPTYMTLSRSSQLYLACISPWN